MIIATSSNSYLLLLRRPISKDIFLKRAGVSKGTYAAELMENIYNDIFLHQRELKHYYQKYFAIEYPTFSLFADNFELIPTEVIALADRHYDDYALLIHYVAAEWFLYDEEGLRLLASLLKLKIKSL